MARAARKKGKARPRKKGSLGGTPAEHKTEVARLSEMLALSVSSVKTEKSCTARLGRAINFFKLLGRFNANYSDAFLRKGQAPATGRYRYFRTQADEATHTVVNQLAACLRR